MKKLLMKELRLALHPTNVIFLLFAAMLLIPSYPYYVAFFYTTLGVFFTCLTGRENRDIEYTMLLPVRRADVVRARILLTVLLEAAQVLLSIPFAVLNRRLYPLGNMAGMEANVALFGLVLVMYGLFNVVFFPLYYGNPNKIGAAFLLGGLAEGAFIVLAELAVHLVSFVRRYLDTADPTYLASKLAVLAIGVALFAALTLLAAKLSERRFERFDL